MFAVIFFGIGKVMSSKHRFLKFILPEKWFNAIRADTKKWLMECRCVHKRDVWDSGGIRYKASGERSELARCPACGKMTMHKMRKKTDAEMEEIG